MYGMLIGTVTNLIFDVLLILILNLNVVGVALSFGISNLFSLIYYVWHLQKNSSNIDLSIKVGIYILSVMLISTLFNGFTGLITSYFQATGKARQAIVTSIAQGTLFIPTIIIANFLLGLHGIIFSMTIAEFLTFLLGICLYFYKKDISIYTEVTV
jgi:Na+-driven multidrug efflux pump